jgi:uncharacterized protein YjbJ (UPF0337 family)
MPSKINGHVDEVVGSIKANVGHAIGNHTMEGEGNTQHASESAYCSLHAVYFLQCS